MNDPEKVLGKMEELLGELILVAEQLKRVSQQTKTEEVIQSLQEKQTELLEQLEQYDDTYRKLEPKKRVPNEHRIQELLIYFEKLNDEFIENLRKSSGLINFEISEGKKKKKRNT